MGNSLFADGRAPIRVFVSSSAWIEGNSIRQLEHVAARDGVVAVAAMPDLHPGKYGPAGAAILARGLHPELAGTDIGCGMGLYALDCRARHLKLDRLADRLRVLDEPCADHAHAVNDALDIAPTAFDASLGSIGGGNHFCEVQAIEDILAPEQAASVGLEREGVCVLVHSGSRGLGADVLRRHWQGGTAPLAADSEAARHYMRDHDHAVRWARRNRAIIAARAGHAAGTQVRLLSDVPHNFIERIAEAGACTGYLHRKGAAAANRGLVPVPGSRGTLSYLVEPLKPDDTDSLCSLAHGAGRKFDRGAMHGRAGATKSDLVRLTRNPFGGIVVCEDRDLLVEEAPEAYKSIARVIADLEQFGLARVVATFRPLVTFKTAKRRDDRAKPKDRELRTRRRNEREEWR